MINSRIFIILLLNLLIITSFNTYAQIKTPPAVMAQINAELQKRGLTEAEVRVRLVQKGIDVDNIPVTELPKYQTQITKVLDELQAEKAARNSGNDAAANKTPQVIMPNIVINQPPVTPTNPADDAKVAEPVTTKAEAAAEAAQRVNQKAAAQTGEGGRIYGHSLFTDKTLDVFRTTDGAQAPDTYILSEGDAIRITIFGASQADIQQKINNEGYIQPTGTAKIFLKGLNMAQAREVLLNRLSSSYTFRPDQFAVTISTARTILVNVFGEAKVTGGFSISALNSAFNALSAAGGPTAIGSVRNIQQIRGNVKKNLDLYAFINDPTNQYKFDLQQNDILFVPVASLLTSIEGAVKRPMIYEMLPNESLLDLIKYAGDVKMDVFPDFVQIERFTNGEKQLKEWNLGDIRTGKVKVGLQNGDIVRIKAIGKPMFQYVDIEGSVYYPGRYDIVANPTLSSVLERAKPTYQAKTDVLFIERTRSDETVEVLSVQFPKNGSQITDFKLQQRDRIRILDQAAYRDVETISVSGQVRSPFSKAFSLTDRLTVKQAIELAGGLKKSVYPVAYIFRKNLFNPVKTEYIRVDLDKSDDIKLQPGDQLNVYDNSTFTNLGEVRVFGAVKTPRSFTYDPGLTLRDVFTTAGGFALGAAFNRVEVFRTTLSPTEKVKLEKITLEVDSTYRILNNSNFAIQPFDHIVVRLTPEFTIGRYVEINGQVKYPGTYLLESKEMSLSDVVKMAGGLLADADPIGSKLFRTYRNRGNITMNVKKALENEKNMKKDPILFEGDVININRRENTITIRERGTRIMEFSTNVDANGLKTIVYQGPKSAKWYIRHYAGGFVKEANKNSLIVILANDQMLSTRNFLFFRSYPSVPPGSVISMQLDPVKEVRPESKEKVNWDNVWSRTLSATTALLTLFILSKQL